MAAETSQTLDRGLRVLEVLADAPDGLTVTELASALRISRTVVYRLVVTLERHALVRRTADGRCRVGLGVLALSRHVQPLLRDSAMPALRRLAEDSAATAYLGVADGPDLLAVAVAEPERSDLHASYRVGARVALDRTAPGRAVLAARSGRTFDAGWQSSVDPAQGARVIAAVIPPATGIEAAVAIIVLGDARESDLGPKVGRAASEIAAALSPSG